MNWMYFGARSGVGRTLALAFAEAWNRGARGPAAITRGTNLLKQNDRERVDAIFGQGLSDTDEVLQGHASAASA
jgi:hypothetical protein